MLFKDYLLKELEEIGLESEMEEASESEMGEAVDIISEWIKDNYKIWEKNERNRKKTR